MKILLKLFGILLIIAGFGMCIFAMVNQMYYTIKQFGIIAPDVIVLNKYSYMYFGIVLVPIGMLLKFFGGINNGN